MAKHFRYTKQQHKAATQNLQSYNMQSWNSTIM